MTLQQLIYSVKIAETKSMNKAAAELFISQPALSSAIHDLEEELNIEIFIRNQRGIIVTSEGENFLSYARQIVEMSNMLKDRYTSDDVKTNKFSVSMQHQEQCKPKIFKRVAKIVTSKAAHERAKIQRRMSSEEFKNYARLRNGAETVPSNMRKNYHLEKIPRGKQRGKFFFGSKIAALNFRKLFNYKKGLGHYAQNPVIA